MPQLLSLTQLQAALDSSDSNPQVKPLMSTREICSRQCLLASLPFSVVNTGSFSHHSLSQVTLKRHPYPHTVLTLVASALHSQSTVSFSQSSLDFCTWLAVGVWFLYFPHCTKNSTRAGPCFISIYFYFAGT